jgi:menaquinone-dependent protoporphyrinogen IX oxidase
MKKTAVIFRSRYGSTRAYAEALAADLGGEALECKTISAKDLGSYDTIVFGGGLYAGSIGGISLITRNWKKLKNKRVVVFTVGLSDPAKPGHFNSILERNFTGEQAGSIRFFHLRGNIDFSKLSMLHRMMMFMVKAFLSRIPVEKQNEEARDMLSNFGRTVQNVETAAIRPIAEYCRAL